MATNRPEFHESHVLVVGLPPELIRRVRIGLTPACVEAISVDTALDGLDQHRDALLIIDARSGLDGLLLLREVRMPPRLNHVRVIYVMDRRTEGVKTVADIVRGLNVEPITYSEDLATVVRAAAQAVGFMITSSEQDPGLDLDQDGDDTSVAGVGLIGEPSVPETTEEWPHLLIADSDARVARALIAEARSRRIHATVVGSLAESRQALASQRPDAVLLDLAIPYERNDGKLPDAGLSLLEDLHRQTPPIPSLVLTARDTFGDRAAVVTHRGRGFLQKPMPAGEVLDAIVHMLEPDQLHANKVMIVNDDPIILKGLETVLEAGGVLTASLGSDADDLFRIWDVFERFVPDVLILDLDIPGMRGIDLCRVVRLDPRWTAMPIVFLTKSRSAETVRDVFAAGADDFVDKSQMSPELVQKVSHWLERAQWYRTMADVDPLTRLPNRRGGRQVLERFLGTVRRRGGTMTVAVLDIDNFKQLNDNIGHAAGDEALRQLADRLRGTFQRPTDIIVRWGGEEFLIGMQDMAREDAALQLERLLEELGAESILGADRELVTFSAGVVQYPTEGSDLYELYLSADQVMYRAKAEGKNRVVRGG